MAAKYLMFRNAGIQTGNDSGNSGNAEPNATSACWPVSSFLGGFGRYLNRGSGSGAHNQSQMYVTLFFKPQRSGGIVASSDQALLSDSVQVWLNNNDGYRAFLEQFFEAIENHDSPVMNVFDSRRTTDYEGFGGRNLPSIAGIYEMKITVDNS